MMLFSFYMWRHTWNSCRNFSRAGSPGVTYRIERRNVLETLRKKTWWSVPMWPCCNFKFRRRTGERRTFRSFIWILVFLFGAELCDRQESSGKWAERSDYKIPWVQCSISFFFFFFWWILGSCSFSNLLHSNVYVPKTLSLFQALVLGYKDRVERKKFKEFRDSLRCFCGDRIHLGAYLSVLSTSPTDFFHKW